MPIYKGEDTFIERIYKGEIEMKRVYKGKDLVWGLYEVIFHDRNEQITDDYQPKRYVWGVDYEIMPEFIDEFDTYKTHFDGWYEDKNFLVAIPAITKDFHKDLNLYAKWRQRRYFYGGTIRWWMWDDNASGGGGSSNFSPIPYTGGTTRTDGAYPYNSDVVNELNNIYSAYSSPAYGYPATECTWWCACRTDDAGLNAGKLSGLGNARSWWDRYSGDTSEDPSDVSPGDIIVFRYRDSSTGQPGHVAFVESRSGDSMRVSECANSTNHPWWLGVKDVSISSSIGSGNHWAWNDEKFLGILKNGGGGGDKWDSEPYSVAKTQCDNQDDPGFPRADDIKRGDVSPTGEYRPSEWSTDDKDSTWQVYYTETRHFIYNDSGEGSWSPWVNEATYNSKIDSGARFLIDWDDTGD